MIPFEIGGYLLSICKKDLANNPAFKEFENQIKESNKNAYLVDISAAKENLRQAIKAIEQMTEKNAFTRCKIYLAIPSILFMIAFTYLVFFTKVIARPWANSGLFIAYEAIVSIVTGKNLAISQYPFEYTCAEKFRMNFDQVMLI